MTTITDFLTARIDEDEQVARAAEAEFGSPNWIWRPEDLLKKLSDEMGEQLCRHDPARVLRECAAKRRLLAYWTFDDENSSNEPPTNPADEMIAADTQFVLRVLAAVYADHEHYNPEWTP